MISRNGRAIWTTRPWSCGGPEFSVALWWPRRLIWSGTLRLQCQRTSPTTYAWCTIPNPIRTCGASRAPATRARSTFAYQAVSSTMAAPRCCYPYAGYGIALLPEVQVFDDFARRLSGPPAERLPVAALTDSSGVSIATQPGAADAHGDGFHSRTVPATRNTARRGGGASGAIIHQTINP